MSRGIVDALYWRLHSSYLRNQREDASKYLAMLEDETKGDHDLIFAEIGTRHMPRFYKMKDGVEDGSFPRLFGSGYETPPVVDYAIVNVNELPKEREFCRQISCEPILRAIVGAQSESIIVLEVEMDEFGRCDIVIRDGRILHVIEVKMGEAPTDVPAQIDRYILAAELDMCLGLHDEVVAHVVAGKFPKYVATELSRRSVGMILHEGRPDRLRLVPAYDTVKERRA